MRQAYGRIYMRIHRAKQNRFANGPRFQVRSKTPSRWPALFSNLSPHLRKFLMTGGAIPIISLYFLHLKFEPEFVFRLLLLIYLCRAASHPHEGRSCLSKRLGLGLRLELDSNQSLHVARSEIANRRSRFCWKVDASALLSYEKSVQP